MPVYGTCPQCEERNSLVEYEAGGHLRRLRRSGHLEVQCPRCRHVFTFDPLPSLPKRWGPVIVLALIALALLCASAFWLGLST